MFIIDNALTLKPELPLPSQRIPRWLALALLVAILIWMSMSVYQVVLPGGSSMIPAVPIHQSHSSCGAVALPC
jgi:hypothetical protein